MVATVNPVLRGLCIHPAPGPAQYSRFVVHLKLERVSGNDPPSSHWQRDALPLSYTRKSPVLSAKDRGASTGHVDKEQTPYSPPLGGHAQVCWLPGFPRPERLHGALYRIIGPALGSRRSMI